MYYVTEAKEAKAVAFTYAQCKLPAEAVLHAYFKDSTLTQAAVMNEILTTWEHKFDWWEKKFLRFIVGESLNLGAKLTYLRILALRAQSYVDDNAGTCRLW
jgi:hypothetical protein